MSEKCKASIINTGTEYGDDDHFTCDKESGHEGKHYNTERKFKW